MIDPEPSIVWSRRVNVSLFGSWRPGRGRSRAAGKIIINRLLNADPKYVDDAMLCYLIYHELLHDALPLRGHDPFFRRLERKWPNAHELDYRYELLSEEWSGEPDDYR